MAASRIYRETFDDGPGGWFGFAGNHLGLKPLEIERSCAVSRSPWWIDYNHAPPGAGYLHLLYMLHTRGAPGEQLREVAGPNRYIAGGFGTRFTDATIRLRLKGELDAQGARLCFLAQGVHDGLCSGWLLTGQTFEVTPEFSEQTVVCTADPSQWTCLGTRTDRADYYGVRPLGRVLGDANVDILLVLFPLTVVPMGPLAGDPHRLRPERDYPVWRRRLPEGYVCLDEISIEFPTGDR